MTSPTHRSLLLALASLPAALAAQTATPVWQGNTNWVTANTSINPTLNYSAGGFNWDNNFIDDSVRYTLPGQLLLETPAAPGFPAAIVSNVLVFLDHSVTGTTGVWSVRANETQTVPTLDTYPADIPKALVGTAITDPIRFTVNNSAGPYPEVGAGLLLFPLTTPTSLAEMGMIQLHFKQNFATTTPALIRCAVQTLDGAIYVSEFNFPGVSDGVSTGSGAHGWRYPVFRNPATANWTRFDITPANIRSLALPDNPAFSPQTIGTVTRMGVYLQTGYTATSNSYDFGYLAYYPAAVGPEPVAPPSVAASLSGDDVVVTFESEAGLAYQLQVAGQGVGGWSTVSGTRTVSTGGPIALTAPAGAAAPKTQALYRVEVSKP